MSSPRGARLKKRPLVAGGRFLLWVMAQCLSGRGQPLPFPRRSPAEGGINHEVAQGEVEAEIPPGAEFGSCAGSQNSIRRFGVVTNKKSRKIIIRGFVVSETFTLAYVATKEDLQFRMPFRNSSILRLFRQDVVKRLTSFGPKIEDIRVVVRHSLSLCVG